MFCSQKRTVPDRVPPRHPTLSPPAAGQAFGEDSDESSSSSEEEDESGSDSDNGKKTIMGGPISGINMDAVEENSPQTASNSGGTSARLTSPPALPAGKFNHAVAADQQGDDDEYLDSIISELALKAAAAAAGGGTGAEALHTGISSPLALLLRCDPRCLKLDQELRRKFGGGDRENGAAAGGVARGGGGRARRTRRGVMAARGGNNSVSASLTLKRLVVSAPKEDWPKPPSFVGGGLGMKRCEAGAPTYLPRWQLEAHGGAEWFVFERSSSLEQLQVRPIEVKKRVPTPACLLRCYFGNKQATCHMFKGVSRSLNPHGFISASTYCMTHVTPPAPFCFLACLSSNRPSFGRSESSRPFKACTTRTSSRRSRLERLTTRMPSCNSGWCLHTQDRQDVHPRKS